jgi:ParB family chromosome partitioning protein
MRAIGKAERIGRGRWQELAEVLRDADAVQRCRAAIAVDGFSRLASEARFARALNAAKTTRSAAKPAALEVRDAAGDVIGEISASGRDVKLVFRKRAGDAFAQFLAERLPSLIDEFRAFEAGDGPKES